MRKRFNINQTKLTVEELEILKQSANDILEFINYVKIFHPKRGMIPATNLFPRQREILKELSENWEDKFHLILSARQSGKSVIVLILILWIITFNSSKVIGILANKKDSSSNLFRRFSNMYHALPPMFRLSEEIGDSKSALELSDGTVVFCGPTSASGLRSESISLLVLDEFAFVPAPIASDFWTSNYPTIEASGSLIVVSTPNGKDNVFYDLYKKAKSKKEKKWELLEVNWKDVFNRDEKWKQNKIKDLAVGGKNGVHAFNQEYNNSFDVVTDAIRFFDQESVAKFKESMIRESYLPDKEKDFKIEIYNNLISNKHYVVGVDISEGKKMNFSALVGFEVFKNVDDFGEFIQLDQAFQLYESDIKPDDFFDYTFKFLINELNDMWYLIFERNDIGRVWDMRFKFLLDELSSGVISVKNKIFKEILIDKFGGDNQLMIDYLVERVYRTMGIHKMWEYGLKINNTNNMLLKTTMKRVVDDGDLIIKNRYLLKEVKQWEDKKGSRDIMTFEGMDGYSHFDAISAMKLAITPLTEFSLLQTVLNIKPLTNLTQNKYNLQYQQLNAITNARNRARSLEEARMIEMFGDELAIPDTVPLEIEIPDSTKGWKKFTKFYTPSGKK